MNYNYIVNCSVLARKSDANKISRFLVSDYGATVKAHTAKEFIQFKPSLKFREALYFKSTKAYM